MSWPAGKRQTRHHRRVIAARLTGIRRSGKTVHRLADAHEVGPVAAARAALSKKRNRER
jgi:hypothetical protein